MFLPQDCYIFIKLHVQRIRMLKLEITATTVMKSIIKNGKMKLTTADIRINNAASLAVSLTGTHCFPYLDSIQILDSEQTVLLNIYSTLKMYIEYQGFWTNSTLESFTYYASRKGEG